MDGLGGHLARVRPGSWRGSWTAAYVTYMRAGGWGPEPNSGAPPGLLLTPVDWAIRRYCAPSHTITRWTELDHGGHFAALEIPGELTTDLREFFRDKRSRQP